MAYKFHVSEADMDHLTPFERIMKMQHFTAFIEEEREQAEQMAAKAKTKGVRG